ncbi:hypothetical protein AVEN_97581-1 [Araneus ventricosus]|uniref:Uncharacterized protein n=1 Tax=Araneus ventricosus TaxID=182803 RepID=A0A4Y2F732_ARAVE|nr:hypothetical protein AVEN_97581-1 [Araneus ventricosus]
MSGLANAFTKTDIAPKIYLNRNAPEKLIKLCHLKKSGFSRTMLVTDIKKVICSVITFKQPLCQLCCITYDDDISEPPYGENPDMGSDDCGKETKVCELKKHVKKLDYVLETIYRSDCPEFAKYEFIDKLISHISDESTYYPGSTTNTATSETETFDSQAYELYDQLKEIYNDLIVLSQKLDEIAYLQKLL